jgi:hypothetical protein
MSNKRVTAVTRSRGDVSAERLPHDFLREAANLVLLKLEDAQAYWEAVDQQLLSTLDTAYPQFLRTVGFMAMQQAPRGSESLESAN